MQDTKALTPVKLGWPEYMAIFLTSFLGGIPADIWQVPKAVSICLVFPLVFLPLYWVGSGPKPRKVSLAKYAGFLLVVTCLLLIVMWALPELLSLAIPRGWAYGLPIFVALQCVYWIPRYRLGQHPASPMAYLLVALLLALAFGVSKQLYNF
jgi:hypothetical protein